MIGPQFVPLRATIDLIIIKRPLLLDGDPNDHEKSFTNKTHLKKAIIVQADMPQYTARVRRVVFILFLLFSFIGGGSSIAAGGGGRAS